MSSWTTQSLRTLISTDQRPKLPLSGAKIWNLNLDQIEKHTGRILKKIYSSGSELGSSTFIFEPQTVLYSKLRPNLNKVVVADDFGVATTELVPLRCDLDKVLPEFVAYFLRSPNFLNFATKVVAGTKMPRMVMSEFWNFEIPVPSLPEQRRIVVILDLADALRAKHQEALAQLDRLTRAVFIKMFGDPATNPKGWAHRNLGEITLKITDGEHLNPTFSSHGMPIIMAGNVLEDTVDIANAKKVDASLGEQFRKKCKPEIGDLLVVSRGATIGRMCVIRTTNTFCLMGSVILIKPLQETINPIFLSSLLKHPVMRSALDKASGSSAQQAIYLKDLKNLSCIAPPIELQMRFSEKVAAINKVKAVHLASLDQMNSLFASLQQRAFSGKL